LEQETIALYEERISAFEAERYDAETMVQALEEKLRVASYQPSPEELSKQASTAAQIDNETLKEQVTHLQQRISHLEDQLEDAQALVEREEEATKSRIARYKEKDTQRQQELDELRRLATSATKSETTARTRVDELEEALRENTAALEDARAEIESLRTDLTVSLPMFSDEIMTIPINRTSKIRRNYPQRNGRQRVPTRHLLQRPSISKPCWMLRRRKQGRPQINLRRRNLNQRKQTFSLLIYVTLSIA
jgi:multidrug efflux pump subunit AcrA (membrane-fusion protein)